MYLLEVLEEQIYAEPLEAEEVADFLVYWYDDHRNARRDRRMLKRLKKQFPYSGIAYRIISSGLPAEYDKPWSELFQLLVAENEKKLDDAGRRRLYQLYRKYANEKVRQFKPPKYDSWSKGLDSLSVYYGIKVGNPIASLRKSGEKGIVLADLENVALIQGHIEGIDIEKACEFGLESGDLLEEDEVKLLGIIEVQEVVAAHVLSSHVMRVGKPSFPEPEEDSIPHDAEDIYDELPF